ncbi:hypothetical protein GHT06_011536 [Daphnia sinensis]|uniref:Uncharacterized protein n=1 Tax=Daphnia sinensis TaxID=1820382 RepID=A0AAD5LE71_9CRUS|nr:hypothetical protein GHT06_011536 [Daphnia sinensis]
MYRPKITTEMRDHRVSGAKNCLRNMDKYKNSVVYSDTQNFTYDEKGKISLYFGSERESSNTVMVWGSISSSSPMASSCRVTGKFDSSKYKDILYPVHRSKAEVEFLSQHNSISVLEWPRYFGDVMPLEQVWLQINYLKKCNQSSTTSYQMVQHTSISLALQYCINVGIFILLVVKGNR